MEGQVEKREEISRQERKSGLYDTDAASIPSENHTERNEDKIFVNTSRGEFGVFDGVGAGEDGDLASAQASDSVEAALLELTDNLSVEKVGNKLERILLEVNERIAAFADSHHFREGVGTTASIVKIIENADGEQTAVIANVGDSRVYVFRGNGVLEQITLDDNLVTEMEEDETKAREIQTRLSEIKDSSTLPENERIFFHYRNVISQHLGKRDIKPHIYMVKLSKGDKILVTSDGIHDNLTDSEIAEILRTSESVQVATKRLMVETQKVSRDEANPRHKLDDMSAIVVQV